MTPAEELRTAAEKLRSLITFLSDNRGPWYVVETERRYPQAIRNKGVPYVVADCFEEPTLPFAVAPYICTMHPGVGSALADWLEIAAEYADRWPPDHQTNSPFRAGALAVARAINGTSPTTS